jgi:hypothetical protein
MTTPLEPHSIPIPKAVRSIVNSLALPPLYNPPSSVPDTPSISSSIGKRSAGRVPLLSLHPLGPLSYAWGIADAALASGEKASGVKLGYMGEPIGSGVSKCHGER